MRVKVAPYGDLQFMPHVAGNGIYPYIPHSEAFVADGPFGKMIYQQILGDQYAYWYTVMRPASDVTIHCDSEDSWLGFRLVLKQHIRQYSLSAGEINLQQGQCSFCFSPNAASSFSLNKGLEYIFFDMSANPSLIRGLDLRLRNVDELLLAVENQRPLVLGEPVWAGVEVLDAIEEVIKYPLRRSVASEVLRRVALAAASKQQIVALSDERIESLYQMRDVIRANITDHIHIPLLARRAGMNEQYFKTGFRQVFGMTPFKFLEYERIKAAKHLLKETSLSMQPIAERTGFKEASSFIRMFAKSEGMSPALWRRRSNGMGLL